jgi:hypothetical protein
MDHQFEGPVVRVFMLRRCRTRLGRRVATYRDSWILIQAPFGSR